MPARERPALGGVGLIVLCFLGSAALRLTESGWALAEEIGAHRRGGGRRPSRRRRRRTPTRCSRRSASARRSSTPRRRGSPTGRRR